MNTICQFLKSLKHVIDDSEHEKQLKLENDRQFPVYIVVNDDMVQVSGKIVLNINVML